MTAMGPVLDRSARVATAAPRPDRPSPRPASPAD
jgi:hypothetical protein